MLEFISATEVRFVIALFLGLLIGLEREATMADRHMRMFGGVRTYALISIFGFVCGWLTRNDAFWILPIGLVSVTALALVAYITKTRRETYGATTEIATLLTFLVGALAILADIWLSAAVGIITAFLLSEKAQLEGLVERLDRAEFLAIIKFLIVTVIILPILPDHPYTRFGINPYHVWQIVVLVSSIGFVGYFLTKRFGQKAGLQLSGLFGGIVSSTAVSVAMGRIARSDETIAPGALRATVLACSVMYFRILVLVWIVNPALGWAFWWKMVLLAAIGFVLSWSVKGKGDQSRVEDKRVANLQNPFEIRPAAIFAILFLALTVAAEYVRQGFGLSGLYGLSLLAGAIDIDPFILSVARESIGIAGAIILAAMSNTLFKALYFAFNAKRLMKETLLRFGAWTVLHIPLIF